MDLARCNLRATRSVRVLLRHGHRSISAVNQLRLRRQFADQSSRSEEKSRHSGKFQPAQRSNDFRISARPVKLVDIAPHGKFHPAFLRDACSCPQCVDPSSKQKRFKTTDIPKDITPASVETTEDGQVQIRWENDIAGHGPDHVSNFPAKFFEVYQSGRTILNDRFEHRVKKLWNKEIITEKLQFVDYEDYMETDYGLYRALTHLHDYGLLFVRGAPRSEQTVLDIARRIGGIRDSFYGQSWDVKSVPEAKNIAYTAQYLGFHMDLLYMANPPGLQFLHCLDNTCEGGSSIFSDSMYSAMRIEHSSFVTLSNVELPYHYRNAGQHYYYRHPVIEGRAWLTGWPKRLTKNINYSPPFQAPLFIHGTGHTEKVPLILEALKDFAAHVESPKNVFEYRMQEGECVIFNNRRVLHGRKEFDTSTGKRWFKGTYVDTDVFSSKLRVLSEVFQDVDHRLERDAQFVTPRT